MPGLVNSSEYAARRMQISRPYQSSSGEIVTFQRALEWNEMLTTEGNTEIERGSVKHYTGGYGRGHNHTNAPSQEDDDDLVLSVLRHTLTECLGRKFGLTAQDQDWLRDLDESCRNLMHNSWYDPLNITQPENLECYLDRNSLPALDQTSLQAAIEKYLTTQSEVRELLEMKLEETLVQAAVGTGSVIRERLTRCRIRDALTTAPLPYVTREDKSFLREILAYHEHPQAAVNAVLLKINQASQVDFVTDYDFDYPDAIVEEPRGSPHSSL